MDREADTDRERHPRSSDDDDREAARRREMVASQIESRGVKDPCVLRAMRRVPRHLFVPDGLRDEAYRDGPLPLGVLSAPEFLAYVGAQLGLANAESDQRAARWLDRLDLRHAGPLRRP